MSTPSPPLRPRWMAIWFNRLSTDRLHRKSAAQSDRPLVFYAKSGNAFTLTATNARAQALGLHVGMALADARAIFPSVDAREAAPEMDAALLDHAAAWCERYTPIIVLDPPQGLYLDISGCAHLFGGEAKLLADVKARLKAQGFSARAAIAPTAAAAWALAHYSDRECADEETLHAALGPLPIDALQLAPESAALLKRLGLKTVAQILNAPRTAFAARAGQRALLRLDLTLGHARDALTPRRPPPPIFALRKLLEPVITLDALLQIARDLCDDLCAQLDDKGFGAKLLEFSAFALDGGERRVKLSLSRPERTADALHRLFREKIERAAENFNAEFGFETARLDALEITPWTLRPSDLAPADAHYDSEAEARLIDRLTARLGAERIGRLGVRDIHAPERANAWQANASVTITPPADGVMRRPLTLFPRAQPIEALATVPDGPPLRFLWRRVPRRIVRAEGPERIEPNWLVAPHARMRDYYRVEDEEGRRYWLYREGYYDDAEPPRWFLHGLFA